MFKEKPFNVILFCSVVTVSTAVLQYLYPQFSFLDGGLITAILLTIFLQNDLYTKIFGVVSLALIVVSTFYPNDTMSRQQVKKTVWSKDQTATSNRIVNYAIKKIKR